MRRIAFHRILLTLCLAVTLFLVSIVRAGSWGPPSDVIEPDFCCPGISGRVSIDDEGNKIAFATYVNNVSNIFVINSDGSGLKQVTSNSEGDRLSQSCSFSGDGTKIAFAKDIYESDSDEPIGRELFVINSDGSELKQLTDKSGGTQIVSSGSPSISDDGSKIAFFHVDFNTWTRGIFVINSYGTGEKQLTENFESDLSISGDGSKIAFLGGDELDFQYYVINSDGTERIQLTRNTNEYKDIDAFPVSAPSISDDGSKIAFEGFVGNDREIFVINSDGTGEKQLTDNNEDDWAPSISGDGSRIAFQRSEVTDMVSEIEPPRPQIYVINSDGTGLTQLTDDSLWDFWYPSISYKGEKIVFWSHFWNPESEGDFESENTSISLVSYLPDVENENGAESPFPLAIAIGGTLPIAVAVMVIFYLKGKKTR
jgi:TolB protein